MKYSKLTLILFVMLLLGSCSQQKQTQWQVTFDKNSKEPYGCFIAYQMLNEIFPSADIKSERNLFREIDKALDHPDYGVNKSRLSIVVCRRFEVDSLELDKIKRYVHLGNTLCIFSENYSANLFTYFHLQADEITNPIQFFSDIIDSIPNQKINLFFNHQKSSYSFNGLPVEHGFTLDSTYDDDIYYMSYARNIDTPSSIISFDGEGVSLICRTPISMTNYFLLQGDNKSYFEKFFSFFYQYPTSVTWYSMYERLPREDHENDVGNLLKFPPLFYAFVMLIALLLFYTVFESKRRQKAIPIISPLKNTSLDFVETVGNLYFKKRDHKNLSEKMILHYFESIRSKYNLKTNALDETFIMLLSKKMNRSFDETKSFIAYVEYIRQCDKLTEIDIQELYHQIQKFS